ncbi:hypothetical protein BDM02DRAFT_948517 [Thelephora ganbajun]|uniref:Uncharacterized protein n=1 Tax=Thelephora ganbajun TaxID=370292 RepID=A0ACB6Z3U9_THEGA|nr:hypothetical protein BDM02DRAFT_948517 [Thelephora ganbajun]
MPDLTDQEYLKMANQAYVVAYVTAVCATTLLYDYALTLGEEITRMWTLRFSIPKCLFLINRYLVIPMLVFNGIASSRTHLPANVRTLHNLCSISMPNTVNSCQYFRVDCFRKLIARTRTLSCVFYLRWLVVCITVTHSTIEGILLTRVWALYRGNMPVLAVACCLYLAGVATLVSLTIRDYVGEKVLIVQDFSALPGCYAASVPALIAGYWIAPVIIESILFVLVMWRAFAWWKDRSAAPPTLTLMYAPPFLSSLFVTPSNTAGCIAGSRLLLNLRSLSDPGRTELEMSTNLQFAGRPRAGNTIGGSEA